jgi:hypothetical protein
MELQQLTMELYRVFVGLCACALQEQQGLLVQI